MACSFLVCATFRHLSHYWMSNDVRMNLSDRQARNDSPGSIAPIARKDSDHMSSKPSSISCPATCIDAMSNFHSLAHEDDCGSMCGLISATGQGCHKWDDRIFLWWHESATPQYDVFLNSTRFPCFQQNNASARCYVPHVAAVRRWCSTTVTVRLVKKMPTTCLEKFVLDSSIKVILEKWNLLQVKLSNQQKPQQH